MPIAAAPVHDAYQLFAHAQSVWSAQRYPQYVSYTIAVAVDERGVAKVRHYRATYDAAHDRVYVEGVSEEERAAPHVPTGMEMTLEPKRNWMTLFKRHVGNPDEAVDFLGVPMLAPNYSFGISPYVPEVATSQQDRDALIAAIRRQYNDPMSPQKEQALSAGAGLKEIGRITSRDRDYDITYAGIEPVAGRSAYHVSLRPHRPSSRLRLRELWIDRQTYATLKLVTEGNFVNSSVPWEVTFATVGGAQYIESEDALDPVGSGRHLYDRAKITFEALTSAEPSRYLWAPIDPNRDVLSEPQ